MKPASPIKQPRQKYFSVKEAAVETGYGRATIRVMLQRGEFKAEKLETPLGEFWLIPADEVEQMKTRPRYKEQRTRWKKKKKT